VDPLSLFYAMARARTISSSAHKPQGNLQPEQSSDSLNILAHDGEYQKVGDARANQTCS
jgi:hypothetical protein